MLLNVEPFWARMPQTFTGIDVVGQVGGLAKSLGGKRILIVTDQGIVKAGLLEKVQQPLEDAKIEFGIFNKCQPDAPVDVIAGCAQFAKEGGYDLLIGLGGGSSMDIAKLAAVAATEDNIPPDIISSYIKSRVPANKLPSIMIPTTAGTGAEVSMGSAVTDADGLKKGIGPCPAIMAIVDPMMTLNLPPDITADTGIDALSHCLERYVHPKSNLLCDTLSEMVIKLISENLRTAYHDGQNRLDVRYNMALAATWSLTGGMMSSGGGIILHTMAYPLQHEVKVSHGRSISVLFPYVIEYNLTTNLPKYARLAELMGETIEGLSLREAAMKSIDAVKNLIQDIGLPQRLRDIGVKKERIPKLVETLFASYGRMLGSNARQVSQEDAAKIYEAAW
jgi:alcohol dehydrogenase class IV